MANKLKKRGFLKGILDSKWAWDLYQGPIYNDLIGKAASDVYIDLVERAELPDRARVIDVGSGPGLATILLARRYPSVSIIGMDFSRTEVNAATRKAGKESMANVSFIQGDAMDLPFPENSFDVAVSTASIKHWPDGVRGLGEIRRVLTTGGTAYVAEADREANKADFTRFATKFAAWYTFRPFMKRFLKRVVFGMSYTCEEASKMAEEAGFEKIKAERLEGWPFFLLRLER